MQNTPKSFRKFKKVPFFLSIVFLALSSTALVFLFWQINTNKKLTIAARTEWQEEEARRYEIKSLAILLEDVAAERTALDAHFARSTNVVPFLDSIEELARKVGADPEVVSVDPAPSGAELGVTARARGSFGAVYKFLELLENSPYELEFTTVDIQKISGDKAGETWEIFLRFKLLSFLP